MNIKISSIGLKARHEVNTNGITYHTCSNSSEYLGLCGSSSQSHAHSIKQLHGEKHDDVVITR